MKLTTQTQDGRLVYFHQCSDNLSVSENAYFRWLNFGEVTQSIMHRRCPWQLTLPHQTALLLPLLHLPVSSVTELGLGGGNLARFLVKLKPDTDFTSVECSQTSIDCFEHYFNPDAIKLNLINDSAENWLAANTRPIPWLIYDIYKRADANNITPLVQALSLIKDMRAHQCVSINVPQSTQCEQELLFKELSSFCSRYQIYCFDIPRYQNLVIHLLSSDIDTDTSLHQNPNNLPGYLFRRWHKLWLLAKTFPFKLN